mgnify:CR=1 FL=1
MNRHNSHQQPEATANDANADQWQIDVSEQGASKVDSYGNASDVNGGRNANDINHTSDQGETVKVQVIKDNQDEPNDRSSLVEQGSQASQTVWASAEDPQYSTNNVDPGGGGRTVQTGTETQPKKRGIIELLGSSPLGVMAQTALDSVRQLRAKKQEYKQVGLIRRTLNMPSSAVDHSKQEALEQQRKHAQLNQLVEDGELDLSNKRVLQTYMDKMRTRTVISDETTESDSKFISKMLREGKINLSDPEMAKEFLDARGYYHNKYFGIREALELGKLDLSNEDIKRHFLDLLDDVKADSVALLDASGLPIEEIAANEHIRQVIVDETSRRVHSIDTRNYGFDGLSSSDKAGDSYRFGVINAICATEDGRQRLADSINKVSGCESVQDVGEEIEDNILQGINSEGKWLYDKQYDELTHNSALIRNVAKYNGVLRKLGWEPLKKDESLAKLFYTGMDYKPNAEERAKKSIDLQDKAYKLGLITPEVTDRLYNHQFKELFSEAKKGSRSSLNNTGDYALLSGYVVSPDLAPSDNNLMANYWRKQSGYLGNSAMRLCMVKALDMTEKEQDDGQRLDLSDLIDEKGILKDAFFQNRPGSFLQDVYNVQEAYDSCDGEEYARVIRFLEAHKDQTSEADGSRAMVNLLGKMKNENGGYDVEAIIDLHHLTDLTDNYAELSDANGLKPEVWQDIFSQGGHLMILRYYQNQDEAGRERMGLDDKQMAVARGYGSINKGNYWNDPRKLFDSYIKEHYDELTIDQIKWTASIVSRLANSNASELAERSEAFTRELLKLDTDKIPEALDKIEDIYIHNHLPYVGKNYLVFRTMHPSPNLEDDFNFSPLSYGRPNTISPVLQQATGDIRSGKLDQMLNSRDAIIVSDLLRASLGSNNRSIREYLDTLKNGQALLDQLSSGELAWSAFNQPTSLMDKDTKANYDTLGTFAWHLATIYNSTLPGKEHPYQLIHQQTDRSNTENQLDRPNSLQTDFTNLTSLIKPNSRYTLADRAVRYFAHFVGIEDLAGAEQYMDNIVKEADARNRKMAEYLATTSEPKLQSGDLVKGMGGTAGDGIRYLSYAFQNGSISKEYLGDASRSDTTPLDADASIVPDQLNGGQTINQIMNSWDRYMLANDYGGGLWAVLRPDEERFIITRRDKEEPDQSVYDLSVPDANFDRTDLTQEEIDRRLKEIAEAKRHRREGLPKLEIFATGVDGSGHYGVRTGFGMNLVSFCVTDSTLRDSTPVSEVTKLEIALGGFYIPIVDRDSEELIYTPDDYDKMREQMSGLSHYSTGDYVFAPDGELELDELTLDKESLSAVSIPSSSSAGDDAQGASSGSITIPGTDTIIDQLPASMAETDHKHEVINQAIKQAIANIPELNLSYKDYLDGDLTENIVEMIDTGSTGRQTNAPGSGDFDYLARLDRSILNDPTKKQQITDALLAAFGRENDGSAIVNGNLRLKQVSIDGLTEPADIDITFAQKTNKVQYPTDAALADRLTNIKNQSETKYQQVLANIIYAKQFLKAAGAYKPRRSPEAEGVGGLGGVGIENWVLQHGGSFKQAARDFLDVADSCSGFEDFCAHYPVWDYGENHKGIKNKPHDNFVADNMNPEGYERMKEALRAVVN